LIIVSVDHSTLVLRKENEIGYILKKRKEKKLNVAFLILTANRLNCITASGEKKANMKHFLGFHKQNNVLFLSEKSIRTKIES
jgi:hypothetical protein